MNITDRQLPPTHKWHCCFGCKCTKIMNDKEQKVDELVDSIAKPIILSPSTPILNPLRKSNPVDFDRLRREREMQVEVSGRRDGLNITLPIDIPIPHAVYPDSPIIRPICPRPESPSPIVRRTSYIERDFDQMKLE